MNKTPIELIGQVLDNANIAEPLKQMEISSIADVIARDWKGKVNFAAKPYLNAMFSLSSVKDNYGADSGKSIVAYFLSNARSWTGPIAKGVKAELNRRLKS